MGILILSIFLTLSSSIFLSLSLGILSQTMASLLRTRLKWASSVPLPPFCQTTQKETKDHGLLENGDNKTFKSGEQVECSVCLCMVEEGEEIRELKCHHLFHKYCLDRWLAVDRHHTCPLCRGALKDEVHERVLFFAFSSFQKTSVHSTWWLRWFHCKPLKRGGGSLWRLLLSYSHWIDRLL